LETSFVSKFWALANCTRFVFLNYRLGQITSRSSNQVADKAKTLAAFADDYRKLAIDCLKVLHVEMKLETIFHMQV
jgi:hypothetical protein